MTEFATQSLLEVEVDRQSLRAARGTIEDEVGDITVAVDASASGQLANSGGSGVAERRSRENAMSRQLLDSQADTLAEIRDDLSERPALDEWETQHELSRERNDLLRELVDATEEGNFQRAKSGGSLSAMIGGGLGLAALGTVGIGAFITGTISFADRVIGKINIGDYLDDSEGTGEGDGGDSAPFVPPDPSNWGGDRPHPGFGQPQPAPSPYDWPGDRPHPGYGQPVPEPGESPSPSNPGMNFPTPTPEQTVGLGISGLAGYMAREPILRAISGGAGSAGAGMPALTPEMFSEGHTFNTNPVTGEDVPPSILTQEGREKRLGPFVDWFNNQFGGDSSSSTTPSSTSGENKARERRQGRTEFTYSPTFELNLEEFKREQRRERRKLEREVKRLKEDISGPRLRQ